MKNVLFSARRTIRLRLLYNWKQKAFVAKLKINVYACGIYVNENCCMQVQLCELSQNRTVNLFHDAKI